MTDLFLYFTHLSLKACVIIPIVILIRFLLQRGPKIYSYRLWTVVFATLLFDIKLPSVAVKTPVSVVQNEILNSYRQTLDSYTGDISIYHDNTVEYYEAIDRGITPVYEEESGSRYVVTEKDSYAPPKTLYSSMDITTAGWMAVMLILCTFVLKSSISIRRKTSQAVHYSENIYLADNISSPFVFGVIKPKIYIPENLRIKDLSYIIAHEQTHIRRKDYLIKPLCLLICLIHWFNPLVWLAYKMMCSDMEMSCDESVIETLGKDSKKPYAGLLLDFAVDNSMTAAVLFGESKAESRIKNILNFKKPSSAIALLLTAVVIITAALPLISKTETTDDPDSAPRTFYELLDLSNDIEHIAYKKRMPVNGADLSPTTRSTSVDGGGPLFNLPEFAKVEPTTKLTVNTTSSSVPMCFGHRTDDGDSPMYSVLLRVTDTVPYSYEIYDYAGSWRLKHTVNLPRGYTTAMPISHDNIRPNQYITTLQATDNTGRQYLLTIHINNGKETVKAFEIKDVHSNYRYQPLSKMQSVAFLNENVGFASYAPYTGNTLPRANPMDIYPNAFVTVDGGENWLPMDFSRLRPENTFFNYCAGSIVTIYDNVVEICYKVTDLEGDGNNYSVISTDGGLTWAGYHRLTTENGANYTKITKSIPAMLKPAEPSAEISEDLSFSQKLDMANNLDHIQYKYRMAVENTDLSAYGLDGWIGDEKLFGNAPIRSEYNLPSVPVTDKSQFSNTSAAQCTGTRIDDNGQPEHSVCVYENNVYTIYEYITDPNISWINPFQFPDRVGIYKLGGLLSHDKIADNYYITCFDGTAGTGDEKYILTVHTINGRSIVNPVPMQSLADDYNIDGAPVIKVRGVRFLNDKVGFISVTQYFGADSSTRQQPNVYITIDGGKSWQKLDFADMVPGNRDKWSFEGCIVVAYGNTIEIRSHAYTDAIDYFPDNYSIISFDGGMTWTAYSRTLSDDETKPGFTYKPLTDTYNVKLK